MIEICLRMRDRKTNTQVDVQHPHLWELLETLSIMDAHQAVPTILPGESIEIHFAKQGQRVRKVVRRSNYGMTGKHPSMKNERMMHWESLHEKRAFHILDLCPLVKSYREQPAELAYSGNDSVMRCHYPDIMVELVNGIQMFIEVKPERALLDPELGRRSRLITRLLRPLGYHYILIVPSQVEGKAYLENARRLRLPRKAPMPGHVWELVGQLSHSAGRMPLSALIQAFDHPDARNWVYQLLLSGVINCDLSESITDQTIVGIKMEGVSE